MQNYTQNEIAKIKEAKRILKNTKAEWIKECSVDNAIHFTGGDIWEELTVTPSNGSSLIIEPVDGYNRWTKVNIVAELNKKMEMIESNYHYEKIQEQEKGNRMIEMLRELL
jgi:hypothetical protein